MFWLFLTIVSVAGKSSFRFPEDGEGLAFPAKLSDSYRVSYNVVNSRSGAGRVLFPETADNVIQSYDSKSVGDGKGFHSSKTQFPDEHRGPEVKNGYGPPTHSHQPFVATDSYSKSHASHHNSEHTKSSYSQPKIEPVVGHDSYSHPHPEPQFTSGGFKPIYHNPQESALHEIEPPVLYKEGEEVPADPEQILEVANFYASLQESQEEESSVLLSQPNIPSPVTPEIPQLPILSPNDGRNGIKPTTEILRRDFLNGTAQTTVEVSHGTEDLFPNIPVFDSQFPPPLIANHYIPPNQPKALELTRPKGQNSQYFDPTVLLQKTEPQTEHFHEGFNAQEVGILPQHSFPKLSEGKSNQVSNQVHHPLVPPVIVHVTVVNQNPEPKVQVVNNNPERLHLIQEVKVVNVSNLSRTPEISQNHMYDTRPVAKEFTIQPEDVEVITEESNTQFQKLQTSSVTPVSQPKITQLSKQPTTTQPPKLPVINEIPKSVFKEQGEMKVTTFRPSGEHLMRPAELESEPRTSSVTLQLPFKEEKVGNATLKIAASSCPKLFGNLSLDCDITPLGVQREDLIFSWRRQSTGDKQHKEKEEVISNGKTVLIDNERYQIEPTPFGSKLTIQNITVEDCGTYVCEAFHARGTGERALIDFLVYLCL